MNQCNFMGRLTRDWEKAGNADVYKSAIAINKKVKGEDRVTFIDCEAWAKTGETLAQYTGKGEAIILMGEVEQDNWEDKDGNRRSKHKLAVRSFSFVPKSGEERQPEPARASAGYSGGGAKAAPQIDEDDIPF